MVRKIATLFNKILHSFFRNIMIKGGNQDIEPLKSKMMKEGSKLFEKCYIEIINM